ncbi:hypothetical protein [Stieleria bergensis]
MSQTEADLVTGFMRSAGPTSAPSKIREMKEVSATAFTNENRFKQPV